MTILKTALALTVLAAAGAATAQPQSASVKQPLLQSGGKNSGEATLTDAPSGVLLRVTASGLTPGWHAMHFHAVGDCSDQAFEKSGAHVNHLDHKMPHGLLNPQGPDFGDLPNIHVGADGTVEAETFTTLVALRAGTARPDLLDADGSALVIHANADDQRSQPIGGAGPRIACAAFPGAAR